MWYRLDHAALLLYGVAQARAAVDNGSYYTTIPTYPSRRCRYVPIVKTNADDSLANATGVGWESALARADAFVRQLNLTEKVYAVTGDVEIPCIGSIGAIPRLNFSGFCLMDGPAGIRAADLASSFPAGLTAAASWDKDLIYQRGQAIGQEFRDKGSQISLGCVDSTSLVSATILTPYYQTRGRSARQKSPWWSQLGGFLT